MKRNYGREDKKKAKKLKTSFKDGKDCFDYF